MVIAVENVIQDQITNGKIVRMDKLGSFYPSISSEGVDREEEFTSANIRGAKINYRAGKRIINALSTAIFKNKN